MKNSRMSYRNNVRPIRSVPITHTEVDEDEALMRAEFIRKSKFVRDLIKELLDEEYLYSPNLSVEDTKQINEHFSDARISLEAGICYIRPDIPKHNELEDEQC